MKNKVFYYKKPTGNQYRPYLQVSFTSKNGTEIKQRGIIDTGADSFLVPYNLGLELGFSASKEDMRRKPKTQGIGGYINSTERTAEIIINHIHSEKVHRIKTPIAWIIPTESLFEKIEKMKDEINVIKVSLQQTPDEKLKELLRIKINEYVEELNLLETEILIGREFMKNFTYIRFVHEEDASKSFFEYEMKNRGTCQTFGARGGT